MPSQLETDPFSVPNAVAQPSNVIAYRFGPFRFRLDGRILERDGELVRVTPKVADTLLVLLQRAGEVISKEQLMDAVWPDVVVVESGLTRNISMLRQALEGDSGEGRYIETVPRRGYRFVGEVTQELASSSVPDAPALEALASSIPLFAVARLVRWTRPAAVFALVVVTALVVSNFALWRSSSPTLAQTSNADVAIGKHLLEKLSPAETARARDYFARAMAAEPNSAEAHAGAALALVQLTALGGLSPQLALEEAKPLASQAVSMDGQHPLSLAAAGAVLLLGGEDLDRAEVHYRDALRSNPSSLSIYYGYTYLKMAMGDLEGAKALVEQAIRLQPASPRLGSLKGQLLYLQEDFEGAAQECRKVLDREPGYALAHYYLALSLGFLHRFEEAHANLDAARLNPDVLTTDRAWLHALQGDRTPAQTLLEARAPLVDQGRLHPSSLLLLAATLGDTDLGLRAVEAAIRGRSAERLTMRIEPRLDSLRKSPRIADLLGARDLGVVASGRNRPPLPGMESR